ncbi:MAG: hypothetical protein Q9P01_21610 [Anaerolineae bacterium]|nr:hypothetical protein [Anaerolineae bacterium]MDQ7037342.1 hypothetical protein [Anaerolineae bacterium]
MQEFYLYLIDGEPVTIHSYSEQLPQSMQESLAYWTHQMDNAKILIHMYKTGRNLDEATMQRLTAVGVDYVQRQLAQNAD